MFNQLVSWFLGRPPIEPSIAAYRRHKADAKALVWRPWLKRWEYRS